MKTNALSGMLAVLLFLPLFLFSQSTIYVSPNGSSSNSGTQSSPTTLENAISNLSSGGTIYMEGGLYNYTSTIVISSNGSSGSLNNVFAYNGTPVINFSSLSESSSNRGLVLDGDYWHFKGIIIEEAGDNGMLLSGNNNIIEDCIFRKNHDTGLQLSRYSSSANSISEWPSNNLILNCEAYDNRDSGNENADGFAAKLTCGTGNIFRGCVAHHNIDDGWDLYTKSETGPIGPILFEDCIAHSNGILTTGGTSGGGDKNGFKLGSTSNTVNHIVRRSIAYNNGKHGFTDNGNIGAIEFSNNTSYNNASYNFHTRDNASHVFKNNLSFNNSTNDRIRGDASAPNSFIGATGGFTVDSSDFETLTPGSDAAPTSNGFLNLKSGSDLIDSGVTTSGISYNGSNPDLGAIEFGETTTTPDPEVILTATAGDASVSLSWSVSNLTASTYEVYRDIDSDPSGRLKLANIADPSITSYTDNTASNGTTYYYWVKVNGSVNSNAASATPSGGAYPSIDLTASAGDASVSLDWTISNLSATRIDVYRDIDSDPSGRVRIGTNLDLSARSYTDDTAINGTTYYYWIKVRGTDGIDYNSNAASATPSGGSSGGSSTTRIEDTDPGTISYDGSLKSYTSADNGTAINLSNNMGEEIVWNYNASSSGTYQLTFRYTRKATMNSSVTIIVNGSSQTLSLSETTSSGFTTSTVSASLNSGNNEIILRTNAGGESADIDWIEITGGSSSRNSGKNTNTAGETVVEEIPTLQDATLLVYPNPTSDFITVRLPSTQKSSIYVFNSIGQLIYSKESKEERQDIDMRNFHKGLYFIMIHHGEKEILKKIIKK